MVISYIFFCRSAAGAILAPSCFAGSVVALTSYENSTMRNLKQLLKTNFGALVEGGKDGRFDGPRGKRP